jgi:hypothetical protein
MTDKHDGFAFPQSNPDVAYSDYIGGGMTLRDYFAGQVLIGLLACGEAHNEHTSSVTAAASYQMADAMLAAREVKL